MFVAKPPSLIKGFYPSLTWEVESSKNEVFITFDDGPTPGVTDKVLQILNRFNAKATFFCLGKNVKENPKLFKQILESGHSVGNHTFDHKRGWDTSLELYKQNVDLASKYIDSDLFRPPYGRISPSQIRTLKKEYRIIMWSNLSMDYHPRITEQKCLKNAIHKLKPGSIIVFHDSKKAAKKMIPTLTRCLEYLKRNNINCSAIK